MSAQRRPIAEPRSLERYIRSQVIPRFITRLREIEDGFVTHRMALARRYAEVKRLSGGDERVFEARWRAVARRWDFAGLNELIRQHNEYYPIERRLPVDPRTGEYLTSAGRPYRREPLGPEWILERFPPTLDEPADQARRTCALPTERTLTRRDLNRALLARQCLLERSRTPLPRTLERVGGLQAQYAPSMYVGLWSRLEGFDRDQLTHALAQRTAVQGTLMRSTIHLVSAGDYWPFAVGIRRALREWWMRVQREGVTAGAMTAAVCEIRPRLAAGPLHRAELEELLGKPRARALGLQVDLVRVPPSGTWERRRADLYGAAEDWLGPPEVGDAEGIEHLVRRYLEGFGPAARADIANWAGLPIGALAPALGRLDLPRLRDEDGGELLDLPRAPLPPAETPAPVRFLPTWDATLLVHARRTGILPEEHRSKVFSTKTPQSVPTFLVDGAVAGTWRHEDGRIDLRPFGRLDGATRRQLREEADRLADLHASGLGARHDL